jgi:hypothetical protein
MKRSQKPLIDDVLDTRPGDDTPMYIQGFAENEQDLVIRFAKLRSKEEKLHMIVNLLRTDGFEPREFIKLRLKQIHRRLLINSPVTDRLVTMFSPYIKYYVQMRMELMGWGQTQVTQEQKDNLTKVFNELQIPFHAHKAKKRKNFMAYKHVLGRVAKSLNYLHLLEGLQPLKRLQRRRETDDLLKKMAKDAGIELDFDRA